MALIMFCGLICFGTGNCTIRPSVAGSALIPAIFSSSSGSVTLSGKRSSALSKPAPSHDLILDFTYDSLGACSPTRITVICGLRNPESTYPATRLDMSATRLSAHSFPSNNFMIVLCCTCGDFDQMITELGLHRPENFPDFAGEHYGIKLLHHLPRAEFTQIAAIPAGRALGILAGTYGKIFPCFDLC